jgi:hypothetical protein
MKIDLAKSGYRTLSKNIPEFAKINEMPIPLDIRRIAEGDGWSLVLSCIVIASRSSERDACFSQMKHSSRCNDRSSIGAVELFLVNFNDELLATLSAGDVVAQELKYHGACLTSLHNKERAHLRMKQ